MHSTKTTLALIATLLLAAAGAWADVAVNEVRPLSADGRVEIDNVSGSIEVIGWSRTEVEITGTLEDKVKELEISAGGDRLHIDVQQTRGTRHSADADLIIKMPSGASLDVDTVSADITVDGLSGDLSLESVSGRIEVSGRPRSLEAASVSGSVRVASAVGSTQLESVSGDIVVGSAEGRLEADVVSGSIQVDHGLLDAFDAETVSGSIFCAARPADRARFSIESMSGTVELVVDADMDADVQIETYSGKIESQIGPAASRSDGFGPGKELRFRAGDGGGRIAIESFSGSIRLRTE